MTSGGQEFSEFMSLLTIQIQFIISVDFSIKQELVSVSSNIHIIRILQLFCNEHTYGQNETYSYNVREIDRVIMKDLH